MSEDYKSVAVSIREAVATMVASSHPAIREKVIEEEARKEAAKLTETLSSGFHAIETLKKELVKIDRPDVVQLGRDGKPLGEGTYSKDRADKIKKTEENLGKWEKALENAWSNGDFSKLKELVKNPPKSED